ncbi:MAG: HAMP domain-containing protein [Thermoleophilaceae bacterium]|nr:HAMP domain-containing protein [Thermoleophilaceae bacterium]
MERQSIRRLIRRGVVAQAVIAFLILLAIAAILARSLHLVSAQERDTRAISQLRFTTLALLGTVGSIDSYAQRRSAEDLATYRQSIVALKTSLRATQAELGDDGGEKAKQTAIGVEQWEKEVLNEVVKDGANGDFEAAQQLLLSPSNDAAIRAVGVAITDLMAGQVESQFSADRVSRSFAIVAATAVSLAVLLLVGGAMVLLLPLRRRVVLPLDELAAASTRIAGGDYSARVAAEGTSEVHLAGEAFNQMAEIVEQHIDKLQELDAMKDKFVASVSHELRTPITSILGYVEMQLEGDLGALDDGQVANLEVIARNASTLALLIDDLLMLSSLESQGEQMVDPQPEEVGKLLHELVAEMRTVSKASGVSIELHAAEEMQVSIDRARMRQVLLNLLSNAVKFSGPGGKIEVDLKREGDNCVVAVRDHGIGIAAADVPRLGQRFFRAGTADHTPGTGLGLTIAMELIELHGGELRISSEPGAGSTFSVVLPLS